MTKPLRILLIEDSDADATLLLYRLEHAGYDLTSGRAWDAASMTKALQESRWDIVICDYVLPSFSGLQAIKLIKEHSLDLPIIVVSGKVGEEVIVECLKAGAHDYVMKSNLTRLPSAVERELREAVSRREKIAAEMALRDSEERFRSAFAEAAIGMALVALDERIIKVNRAMCLMLGYTEAELLHETVGNLTHPEDVLPCRSKLKELLNQQVQATQVQKRFRHKNGETVWCLVNSSLVRDERREPQYYICQIENVTRRLQLESQLRQSQKMEAVGRLASGVAHDFNNILTVILGCSSTFRAMIPNATPGVENLDLITSSAERAAGLTQQLLTFSRKQPTNPIPLDLNKLVANTHKLLSRLIGEDIELVIKPGAENCWVKADAGQIEQIVMNLAVNARDAMPRGGKLAIETSLLTLNDQNLPQWTELPPGGYAVLTMSDTGTGMTADVQAHIFEPFFTTKQAGKGTGLGLATVYGIIKQHYGAIQCHSTPGCGTRFDIYLPMASEQPQTGTQVKSGSVPVHGSERIMVVEDEEALRKMIKVTLERHGYRVITASHGEEALEILHQQSEPISLLLTDVIMPKKSGPELAREVRAMLPGVKVLFNSGYTDDVMVQHGVQQTEVDFIQKPYSIHQLVQKVREILDREPKKPVS